MSVFVVVVMLILATNLTVILLENKIRKTRACLFIGILLHILSALVTLFFMETNEVMFFFLSMCSVSLVGFCVQYIPQLQY